MSSHTLDRTDFEDTFTRILKRQQPRKCEECGRFFLVALMESTSTHNGYIYPQFEARVAGPWSCEDCR